MNEINFLISLAWAAGGIDVGDPMLKKGKCCEGVRAPPTPQKSEKFRSFDIPSIVTQSVDLNGQARNYLYNHIYSSPRPFLGNITFLYSRRLVVASMLAMVSRSESELKFELAVEWKLVPKDVVSLSKCF